MASHTESMVRMSPSQEIVLKSALHQTFGGRTWAKTREEVNAWCSYTMLYTVFFASVMNSPSAEMVDLWDVEMSEMDLLKRTVPVLT